jgi:primosomal protein N' (replication factor Y)
MKKKLKKEKVFFYPPYSRLIHIRIRHKSQETTSHASDYLAFKLREHLTYRVQGPAEPIIARIRGLYIREILIKLERKQQLILDAKKWVNQICFELSKQPGWSNVRLTINVDPQ